MLIEELVAGSLPAMGLHGRRSRTPSETFALACSLRDDAEHSVFGRAIAEMNRGECVKIELGQRGQ